MSCCAETGAIFVHRACGMKMQATVVAGKPAGTGEGHAAHHLQETSHGHMFVQNFPHPPPPRCRWRKHHMACKKRMAAFIDSLSMETS